MTMRLRLLQGATALLYMGPLLAGLAGFGWAMLPPFVSVYLLWLMIMRPHQWPRTNADWLRGEVWLVVLTQALTQILLVSVLFGIGRGLGGVMGHLPMFHPLLPVAVSFLAIPVSRLAWDSEQALEQGLTIDEVMYPHSVPAPLVCPALTPDEAVKPLLQFADDAPLAAVGPVLEDVLDDGNAWARLSSLTDALEAAPNRHAALREALVVWATDPETFSQNAAPAAMRAAFQVVGSDPGLLRHLLPRAAALARAMPERHGQFPDLLVLDALSRLRLPAQVSSDLSNLMSVLGHRSSSAARAHRKESGLATSDASTT